VFRIRVLALAALVFIPRAGWSQGQPLGPEFRVNTYTTGDQRRPSVAAAPSGDFLVVWDGANVGKPDAGIFGQRYNGSGTPLGQDFRVNTYLTGYQVFPSVAADGAGNFVVVWNGPDGFEYGVFGQRFANSGAPLGSEFQVNIFTANLSLAPAVAADSSGNFIVVWSSGILGPPPADLNVYGQRYSSSGIPLGSNFMINTLTTDQQSQPVVAADGAGNFVVVWASLSPYQVNVFGRRFASSGGPLGNEFRVNTHTGGAFPSVAAAPSGDFVVVWQGTDGIDPAAVVGQRYASSGVPLGTEFRVNTYTTNNQTNPRVATDAAGNFVVAWVNYLGGYYTAILGQRYASSGIPLGSEFRVNQIPANYQFRPAVAADTTGNFVVAWEALYLKNGLDWGVFGQRFAQIVPVELVRFTVE
jgi:hypothetical protein